ncbi:MAG TPA: hypothetical protein DD618_03770, partial [Acholeplasmatales bacterium]|nr:hypothetical protein [Acholeplasmatales bacterium]
MAKRTIKKSVKKAPIWKKLIGLFLFLGAASVFGGFGYRYFTIAVREEANITEILTILNESLPEETTDDLVLPTSIPGYDSISIAWASDDSETIYPDGKVYRPLSAVGDKRVVLTATFTVLENDRLAQLAFELLGVGPITQTFEVLVLKMDLTDQEKVDYVASRLYVPEDSFYSLGLLTSVSEFPELTISWSSSDPAILTNAGAKAGTGSVTLTAEVSLGSASSQMSFPITMLASQPVFTALDPDLEAIDTGTYATDWTAGGFIFHQAILALNGTDAIIRMKADQSATLTTQDPVFEPSGLTFDFQLYATDAEKLTKPTTVLVSWSDDLITWTNLYTQVIADANNLAVDLDVSGLNGDVYFQVAVITEYLTDLRVDVDNLIIERELSADDIEQWIEANVPDKTNNSLILPRTTGYGGIISWSSSDPTLMSDDGLIDRPAESTDVIMTATVTGLAFPVIFPRSVTILGVSTVEPLELYFIDLGKYGTSDTGESIYFKLGDFDVLIDAGSNFNASNQALSETIDAHSEDRIIDLIVATHPDADHIGGLPFIFSTYEVKNLFQFYGDHTTLLYQEYVSSYQAEGLVSECLVTDAYNNQNGCSRVITIQEGVTINVVDTGYYQTDETNGRSVVFVLEAYGTRILLTGDADNNDGRTAESNYMNEVGDIDILKAVHHATSNGTTSEFLAVVDPETVIITNGN